MKRRYQVVGEFNYIAECDCEWCRGHERTKEIDDTFDVDLPDGSDGDSEDEGTRAIIIESVQTALDGRGYDDAEFEYAPDIELLPDPPIDVTLRELGAPMLPGFRGL